MYGGPWKIYRGMALPLSEWKRRYVHNTLVKRQGAEAARQDSLVMEKLGVTIIQLAADGSRI